MIAEVVRVMYRIDLTHEQWGKLRDLDYLDDVMKPMEKIGAFDIEYNGHFGRAIFFSLHGVEIILLSKIIQYIEKILS